MSEESSDNQSTDEFLYSLRKYYGEFTPVKLAFNANLQVFAQYVSYLCNLEANGKISPETTYQEIKKFWEQLKQAKENLLENDNLIQEDHN